MIWLILFFLLIPNGLRDPNPIETLIVWNVGQGQFVTWMEPGLCLHFDMGGEKMDWQGLQARCWQNRNEVYLSHWDEDHIGFVSRAQRILPNLCLRVRPLERASLHKVQMLDRIPDCEGLKDVDVTSWSPHIAQPWTPKISNDFSHVQLLKNWAVIPGDSPIKEEKIWSHELAGIHQAKILILGHHGSRTSSSKILLQKLSGLKTGISSARFARYGHPHVEVIRRLKAFGVSLLKTEDWGTIVFIFLHANF